ncbi:MAG: thioredoxin [Odoribacter sp.]|nr:thioredoxin [Odoribacter sp.]
MAFTFTDENVKEIIATGQPVVIDFWATWCGPCMSMAPVIDRLAAEYEGRVVIGKYNVDEESDFSTENRIMSLPTILFFKNGQKTELRLAGSQNESKLRETIEKLIAL